MNLFSPLKIRSLEFKNRVFVSPMCQYSCEQGVATDWHLVHLGARASGGAALVMTEAAAVSPEGRISPADLGIWNEDQVQALKRITQFIKSQHSIPAIQLAHAGRKASIDLPWLSGRPLPKDKGGWPVFAPSPLPFSKDFPVPLEMTETHLKNVKKEFIAAAYNSLAAGFSVIEIHMAHGYLFHQFLSPISNQRTDSYGGSLENRLRFPLEVATELRQLWPDHLPVFVRISATDWCENGWTLGDSEVFCRELKKLGIDLIDCSTGGNVNHAQIPLAANYQVPFAEAIRKNVGILVGAVGLITEPTQAEQIIQKEQADVVFVGRELLRDPHWPLRAAQQLKQQVLWPPQYLRAKL